MASGSYPLDVLHVASPCPVSWDAMPGDGRVRFCPQCRQHVYNLSAMNRAEAETLLAEREGRVCVRFYRRADGTVLTSDCPVGLWAVRRRLAVLAGAVAGLLLLVPAWRAGMSAADRGGPAPSNLKECVEMVWEWFRPPSRAVTMGTPCPPSLPPAGPVGGQMPAPPDAP
jgi:hypothetical protein